ncbi:MAG: energy-coupling factor transporter transmembrane component T family protein [Lachnospiraceae bacterium]|jgi:energy-coupling factor transport system permease protein
MDSFGFAGFAPGFIIFYYSVVIVLTCAVMHPAYLAVSLAASITFYIILNKGSGIKPLVRLIPVFLVLSVINPVFNTKGEHVLFVLFGRNYTFEALIFGISAAMMVTAVIIWFMSFGKVMSSDRLTSVIGKRVPVLSLLLVMVFRLIPTYERKGRLISESRKCVGKGITDEDGIRSKLKSAAGILGALSGWALESSVVMAGSMKSRGYGCTRRTSFEIHRKRNRDIAAFIVTVISFFTAVALMICGAGSASFIPALDLSSVKSVKGLAGICSFAILVFIPSAIDIWENISWALSKSKI